jgi:hypothetical protein
MRGNNWQVADLSEASFHELASSLQRLQSPDCEEIFKGSTLYYGNGGTAVLHMKPTIRINRIRSALRLDWKAVPGSIESIVADLNATESPVRSRHFSPREKKSAKILLTSSKREDKIHRAKPVSAGRARQIMPTPIQVYTASGLDADSTTEPEAASALSPENIHHRYLRLEGALVSENEEKKRITQQLLRIYHALSGGSVPEIIDADACEQIADRMISANDVEEERNLSHISQLQQQIADLQSKNQKLERAYSALDQLNKKQGMEARQNRRLKAVRKSQHGWSDSASAWVDRSTR